MTEATCSRRDAASVLFDLPGYRALEAIDTGCGGRRVTITGEAEEDGCPSCGVLSSRVHQRVHQRLADVPVAGNLQVVLVKRRFVCAERLCARRTFVGVTDEVPLRARVTTRLRRVVTLEVTTAARAVSEVARSHLVSWWTAQQRVSRAAAHLVDTDVVPVRRLGIDEHRYRRVRYFRDAASCSWRRYEPWMSTFVDTDTGRVLGVVDGRDSVGVRNWLVARPQVWKDAVQVVAIDPSAAFRKALREHLPEAAVSVDAFHLVKLGNEMVTGVRQRVSRQHKGRRGRVVDASWAHRRLLLRAGDTLSPPARQRLNEVFGRDDPTKEISAAWGIKEQLRRLLSSSSLAQANEHRMLLTHYVQITDMPETDRLLATIQAWWPQIEVLLVTGVTNARAEAANTTIKHIKRSGRGFRNAEHYRARILLASAAHRAA